MDMLRSTSIERIKNLPDGSTLEDIMYEINFIGQVLEGIADADANRTISTEELLNKVVEWGKP